MTDLKTVVSDSVKASMARTGETLRNTRQLLNRIEAERKKIAAAFEKRYVTRPKK